MTENDIFETRLRSALARRVANVPVDFDALAFARTVVASEPRGRSRAATIAAALRPRPGVHHWWLEMTPSAGWSPALRMAWLVVITGLLLAATVSAILIGSELVRRPSELNVVPPPTVVPAPSTTPAPWATEQLTISAHPARVAGIAWSPDGANLATAGYDGTAKVWDATNGDELLRFTIGDSDAVLLDLAYSPDGTRIAAGMHIYDAATGDALLPLVEASRAFSPDGTRLAVGGAWGWAAVVNATTGEIQLEFPMGGVWMSDAEWSPDGTRLATIWRDGVKIWNAATGDEQEAIALGPTGTVSVTDFAWSPDGTRIAAASDDGTVVRVYDITTGDLRLGLEGRASVAWSPAGTWIATAGDDGTATIWDAISGDEQATLAGHPGPVTAVAWSPDGSRIATASDGGAVKIWKVVPPPVAPAPSTDLAPPPTEPLTIAAHPFGVAAVAWSPDGAHLATASRILEELSAVARVWDSSSGEELRRFTTGSTETGRVLISYSPDGARIASGTQVFDAATGDALLTLSDAFKAFSPDGTRIAVANDYGWLWKFLICDSATGDLLVDLGRHSSVRGEMAWSPDGSRIALTREVGIDVMDTTTGGPALLPISTSDPMRPMRMYDVAWSPDGTRIATAGTPSDAQVWDATTGDNLATLVGHAYGGVEAIAWSPTGTWIATAGGDGTARIWDAVSGDEQATLSGHTGPVRDVAWSPDGTRIATASDDGTVKVWQVRP